MTTVSFGLEEKVAVITGSTKGIGYEILRAFAEAGTHTVVVSRHQDECLKVAQEINSQGLSALAVPADVSNYDSIHKLVDTVYEYFGQIDILVNNAGTAVTKPAVEINPSEWNRVMDLNLKGLFFCSQAVGKKMMQKGGCKIINVASIFGLVGERSILPYCVSKGGVIQLTRALALEWAKYNIRVNALCPGYVKTEMNSEELSDLQLYQHIIRKIPMRRLGDVSELVGAALYLGSDLSSYMTGQTLVVDGGWLAE
ncbi:glucose 1-dehydrogenase [Paradesulfitobacterium aromaticivorans]